MQTGKQCVINVGLFSVWVLPRILPLLLYPGVYSFDAWLHIGMAEATVVQNRIPFGTYHPYLYTPWLHLLACLIHDFLGLGLIDTFRLLGGILIILGFLSFYALFRCLLGRSWASATAMLFFSIDVDVVSQTNAVIPENLALTFLALTLLASVALIRHGTKQIEWIAVIAIAVCGVVFTHHLTTYFLMLFAVSLLLGSILSKNANARRIGLPLSSCLAASSLVLLFILNPFLVPLFQNYTPFIVAGLLLLVATSVVFHTCRDRIWRFLGLLRGKTAGRLLLILGGLAGISFFAAVLFYYPYERSWLWIGLKFGLFSCLLGLGLTALRLLPWMDTKTGILGLFIGLSFLVIGTSFGYTGALTLFYASVGQTAVEVFIGHRHIAFLLIPLAVMSAFSMYLVYAYGKRKRFPNLLTTAGLSLLMITFSIGGIWNLYAPAGGWYPEWCSQSEINAGLWLSEAAPLQSIITTDKRLTSMMQGMFPAGTARFHFFQLDQEILANPMRLQSNPLTHQHEVYFMTSGLMEAFFILKYLVPPISLQCSNFLDVANSTAKILAGAHASTYWLAA